MMTAALSIPCMPWEPSRDARFVRHGAPAVILLSVARKLVIKVTAGKDEPERCNQAFTVASTAIASGVPVSLWLTGEAAWLALPGQADDFSLPHAAPLADLLTSVVALGTVTVCSQCAARRDITPPDVIAGIRIAGSATFVS